MFSRRPDEAPGPRRCRVQTKNLEQKHTKGTMSEGTALCGGRSRQVNVKGV
jgi:hypothetical protein